LKSLELAPDIAFFNQSVQCLVACFYENERPLQGVAGLLDWRFQGALSSHIKSGFITGQEGECVWIPLERAGRKFDLLLVGGGTLSRHRLRGELPAASWQALRKNLLSLKFTEVGISKKDLGELPLQELRNHLEGVPLCLAH
jgi:hypothetical protein